VSLIVHFHDGNLVCFDLAPTDRCHVCGKPYGEHGADERNIREYQSRKGPHLAANDEEPL